MRDERERIALLFEEYFAAFATLEPRAVLPFYNLPCMLLTATGLSTLLTVDDVQAAFARMMRGLHTRGYARSQIDTMHTKLLAGELAIVALQGSRYTDVDEKLESFRAVYTMRRHEDAWRIVLTTVHDPEVVVSLR